MTHHLPRLDSVRGIAALMVAGFHAGLSAGSATWAVPLISLLGFFFDGRNGVCIFFVLSGLVLGISLRRSGALTSAVYFHFCGRRLFRLYPAFLVSTFIYFVYYDVLRHDAARPQSIGHGWCDYYLANPASTGVLWQNFFFLSQYLNVASWTLKVEAQAALLFPLFHLVYCRTGAWARALLLVALIVLSFESAGLTGGSTRIYLYLFYLGYLIPPVLKSVPSRFWSRSSSRLLYLALTAGLFASAHLFGSQGFARAGGSLLAAGGAFLLLLALLSEPFSSVFSFLDHAPIRFLGEVSYSFYLYNLFCVDLTERILSLGMGIETLRLAWGWPAIFLTSSLLGLALSALSYRWVERLGIRLGGHFLPSLGPRPPVAAP